MMGHGYIAIARGILDHPVIGARKPYSRLEAWLWLLLEAAWKPHRVGMSTGYAGRGREVIELQRGQLTHSLRFMADKWGWSVKAVRSFLTGLEKGTMVATAKGTAQTVITICNYEVYQTPAAQKGTANGTLEGTPRAQQGHKVKEGNKEIRENTRPRAHDGEPEGFAEWYEVYPRKKQRKDAAKAYRRIVPKEISHADLVERTRAFAAYHKANTPAHRLQFIPYPATWLNSGEYLDTLASLAPVATSQASIEAPQRDPHSFTETEWRDRLSLHQNGQKWPRTYWGPAPGESGCLVPRHLLVSAVEAAAVVGAEAKRA